MSTPSHKVLHPECAPFLRGGRIVILGLSGGRDSVALLHLLQREGCRVYALHLHHGLRAAAADADAQFCTELCAQHDIPLELIREDVPRLAHEAGLSFEHMGRERRRKHLGDYAQRIQREQSLEAVPPIALAHHADDQAETILFNLCRGSAGLRGMRALSEQGGCIYLRPLLDWRREEITQYLDAQQQSWRDDETNDEDDATRNALRHQVIPLLCELMARDIVPILSRSACAAQQKAQALDAALPLLPSRDPQGRLYLPFLRAQPPSLQRAILFDYLREHAVSDLGERHIEAAVQLISHDKHVINLPQSLRLRRRQGRIYLESGE